MCPAQTRLTVLRERGGGRLLLWVRSLGSSLRHLCEKAPKMVVLQECISLGLESHQDGNSFLLVNMIVLLSPVFYSCLINHLQLKRTLTF